MAGLLDPWQGDGTYVENRPSKWAQTWGILGPYVTEPFNAMERLWNSPAIQYGFEPSEQDVADSFNIAGSVVGAGSVVPKPDDALNMGAKAFRGSSKVLGGNNTLVNAWHATEKPFTSYDWGLLGSTTRPNVEGTTVEEWAMDLARVGPWSSEKKVNIGFGTHIPVTVGGKGKTFNSLDNLQKEIAKAGGPDKFRQDMIAKGFGHLKVADEELGGISYVSLKPETFTVNNEPAIAALRKDTQ